MPQKRNRSRVIIDAEPYSAGAVGSSRAAPWAAQYEENSHAWLGPDLPDRRTDCRGSWIWRHRRRFDRDCQDHLLRRGRAVPDFRAHRALPRAHTHSPVAATLSEQTRIARRRAGRFFRFSGPLRKVVGSVRASAARPGGHDGTGRLVWTEIFRTFDGKPIGQPG